MGALQHADSTTAIAAPTVVSGPRVWQSAAMTAKPHRIFTHGSPEPLAPGLWRVVGSLPFPLKRNMFIWRMPEGGLLLYSVVALSEAGMAALEALGRPAIMVVPHPFHVMDAPFYAARYPELKIVGLPDAGSRTHGLRVDATPEAALAPLGVRAERAAGLKYGELCLDLPLAEGAGRAFLCTDLFGRNEGRTALMMKLLGPPGGEGVARIVRWRQIADKNAVRAFLRAQAEIPGLSLTAGCHGAVVRDDPAGFLRRAADAL
jgi:hypothetical protein